LRDVSRLFFLISGTGVGTEFEQHANSVLQICVLKLLECLSLHAYEPYHLRPTFIVHF